MMNAVVLTAVLSCLNSGLYTASRMLFVLAARREAPVASDHGQQPRRADVGDPDVHRRRVPVRDRRGVSPDTVFLFLLNSSGAIILFVYLLIAVSQLVLRRRTPTGEAQGQDVAVPVPDDRSPSRRCVAVLVLMFLEEATRPQLLLSLLAWAVVLVLYAVTKWRGGSVGRRTSTTAPRPAAPGAGPGERDGGGGRADRRAARDRPGRPGGVLRLRPGQPAGHRPGRAPGAVWVWEETGRGRSGAARRDPGHPAQRRASTPTGELGDHRPMHALRPRCTAFQPDRIVISTHPEVHSAWLRHGVVHQARHVHSLPVTHVVSYVGRPVAPEPGSDMPAPGSATHRGPAPLRRSPAHPRGLRQPAWCRR